MEVDKKISSLVADSRPSLARYEELYKHFHSHPELSNQERETAATICAELEKISSDWDIRPNIGGHGIAALLSNGVGPTILLRADMDALPVEERTGLPYASSARMRDADGVEKPVMHACGHDMHMAALLAAAETLHACKSSWSGTLLLIFQPAEERGSGAQAMIDDGLYSPQRHAVPIPDVCMGAHVSPFRAGTLGTKAGLLAGSADSLRVTLHGRGGHASMPERVVDPIVMAASTVMRLQTIVSREIAPADKAVVTVASISAGDAENIVVDDAKFSVDVRAFNPEIRNKVNASVRRIIAAEALAGNAVKEPTITTTRTFPLTVNDDAVAARLEKAFAAHFPADEKGLNPATATLGGGSEDFSILGTAVNRPCSFWLYGGTPQESYDAFEKEGTLMEKVPVNHSALFYPAIQPTLTVGCDAYAVAALAWLAKK